MSRAPGTETEAQEEAARIVERHWGLEARLEPLPSYADTNYRVVTEGGSTLLRLANAAEAESTLRFQERLLARLAEAALPTPRALPGRSGDVLESVSFRGETRWARLHSWLPGRPLATVVDPSPRLFADLGRLLARIDQALENEPGPDEERLFPWDPRSYPRSLDHLEAIPEDAGRERVARVLEHFRTDVLPRLDALPAGVVHNDANDYNALVDEEGQLTGLTDFGDALLAPRVVEAAVAATYAMCGRAEPASFALALLEGFQRERPLEPEALPLFFPLIEARLAVSVVQSAAERARRPHNEYASVTEPHAWRLLEWFERQDLEDLTAEARNLR